MMKTKSTIVYKKWDIVLVDFPFSANSSPQKRPALIVSPEKYNAGKNVIILQISSKKDLSGEDYQIKDWESANLLLPSFIKMKFATVKNDIIRKKIGRLSQEDISIFENYL
ncbi:MAG: type II toxin-antitoxin system PemK/MazF family toxin [Candidatus Marinimicrobia bacterium]|nr:type II toxin-antitoxin system PemK/MazF family toxin [Candidatus Neomarinimicrobiota bacterium]